VVDGSTTKIVDYLDGFQTEERGSRIPVGAIATQLSNNEQYAGEVFQFFPHPEGYVKATPGAASINSPPTSYSYNYVYNYTDHLDERIQSIALFEVCERSSVRLSYSKNPATNQLNILDEIEERDSRIPEKRRSHLKKNDEQNHYYPFGLKHEVYVSGGKRDYRAIPDDNDPRLIGVTQTDYQYKYNGKELQDELGLGLYDYGARNYDPALGRFFNLDRYSEVYFAHTPYHYTMNNPIYYVDVNGDCVTIHYGEGESYSFCGDSKGAPKNEFVQQVITAYNTMLEAGGGSFTDLVSNNDYNVDMKSTENTSQYITNESGSNQLLLWNPLGGQITDKGIFSSYVTLEHEGDHALRANKDRNLYNTDRATPDENKNVNEKKSMAAENSMAAKLKELEKGETTKSNYTQSTTIITTKPGSQEMDTQSTVNRIQKQLDSGRVKSTHIDSRKKLIDRIQAVGKNVKTHKVEIKK
jgi:RHS repeat-associated protein